MELTGTHHLTAISVAITRRPTRRLVWANPSSRLRNDADGRMECTGPPCGGDAEWRGDLRSPVGRR
jgi:hypothetical protein